MEKERYGKPVMEVIEMNGKNNVIITSCTPVDVPPYDDWFE